MKLISKIINILLNVSAFATGLFVAGCLTYWSVMLVIILKIDPLAVAQFALAAGFTVWRVSKMIGDKYEPKAIRDSQGDAEVRGNSTTFCDGVQSPVPANGRSL